MEEERANGQVGGLWDQKVKGAEVGPGRGWGKVGEWEDEGGGEEAEAAGMSGTTEGRQ